MKKAIAALAAAIVVFLPAAVTAEPFEAQAKATTFGTDLSGLWYVPAESGWGANIIQQAQTMFVTLFVYGSDNRPTWLVGPDVSYTSTQNGALVFTGTLYQTSGPWFGAASFNPSAVGVTAVGTVTVRASRYDQATLSYTASGTTVTKTIVPQTWRANDLTGSYIGGMFGAVAACNLPLPQVSASLLGFDVTHNITTGAITMVVSASSSSRCTLTGTVTQNGKQATVSGNFSCTNGQSGAFALGQLEAGFFGLTGFYVAANTTCGASAASIGAARVS